MSDNPERPEDLSALTGLYALDALDGSERERFEAFLRANPEARIEVDEFRETAAQLSTLSSVEPPAALRSRVLSQLADIPQEPQLDQLRPVQLRSAPPRPVRTALLALAAAVALVVAGFIGYSLRSTGSGGELAAVLSADDARVAPMDSPEGLKAGLIYSVSEGKAVVLSGDLPAPPEGKVYQLWRVRGDSPVSGGTLASDQTRRAVAVPVDSGDVVAVTVEPAPGSSEPTSPIVMSAKI